MATTFGVEQRIAAARAAWRDDRGVVLVSSGDPVPIAGTDQFHRFHPHPDFRYLSGLDAPSSKNPRYGILHGYGSCTSM